MKFLEKAKNILEILLDCIFPRCCVVCNRKVDLKNFCNLCSDCLSKVPWIIGQRCSICSRPMRDISIPESENLFCENCRTDTPLFKSGLICWQHKGVGRDIVLTLKYRNAEFLKNDIANLLKNCPHNIEEFIKNSILVPVPIHYFRRIKRGYNQTEVIASALSKIENSADVYSLLKSSHKKSQTKLKRTERLLNVQNRFFCSPKIESIPRSARLVLVDDVSTTGSTLKECCKVLRNEGFDNLHVLTLSCD